MPLTLGALVEVTGDQVLGGGIAATILGIAGILARRTRDTDERRDEVAKMAMDLAMEREGRAWSERDEILAENRDLQRRLARLRVGQPEENDDDG